MQFNRGAERREVQARPCRLGEDNEYVYRELLGYSEAEYAERVGKGYLGTAFTPAALGVW